MIDAVNAPLQTVAANGGIIFNATRIRTGCTVRHEQGSSRFVLTAPGIYSVHFSGNIALPAGATAGPISVSLSVDGETVAGTDAVFTPAAAGDFGNVSINTLVRAYGCCATNVGVSVVNSAGVPIEVEDTNLIILRQCGGGNA